LIELDQKGIVREGDNFTIGLNYLLAWGIFKGILIFLGRKKRSELLNDMDIGMLFAKINNGFLPSPIDIKWVFTIDY